MLANRVRKRARHLRKWARRNGISCYRIYDRDIPEIPLVIDWYEGHLHIALFHRGQSRDEDEGEARGDEPSAGFCAAMADAAACALEVPGNRVHIKERRRQRGSAQYRRLGRAGEHLIVSEGGHRFAVNLRDYLDTGLFLDHRATRARIQAEARGSRFLNLFCYTGAFTVYAAAGGARATVSVDLSKRYLEWARRNLALNGYDGSEHRLVRADVVELLHRGAFPDASEAPFDLAVLDPPTFSNSKKMSGVIDVRRDHPALIAGTLALLRPGGALYFSTNARRFRLDEGAIDASSIADLSRDTAPPDFARHRPHRSFRIVK